MTYEDAKALIFDQLPNFQKSGSSCLKYNLDNIRSLCEFIGNPQMDIRCVHVGGTNGKGSCSHMIASILQESGYTVGLYTSPHLKSYRERFRINGKLIPKDDVLDFVRLIESFIESNSPTFFEVSVALAFYWFKKSYVDFAVIEVGLGGRLDSTNIITPILSVITSIGFDHQKILGNTLAEIATEKAGIIKNNIPVVIGERNDATSSVFILQAEIKNAPIFFTDEFEVTEVSTNGLFLEFQVSTLMNSYQISSPLSGLYQVQNILTTIRVAEIINRKSKFQINAKSIEEGVRKVISNTGLKGRWQLINKEPITICDTGHNEDAWAYLGKQITDFKISGVKHVILGFSNDKDLKSIIKNLPENVNFYFTEFSSNRSLKIKEAKKVGINFSRYYVNVNSALQDVNNIASYNDFIFIGGSTYVVAEIENL